MKINEVVQSKSRAIFESLSYDSDHPFSKSTLMEIADTVSNSEFEPAMTAEQFFEWLDGVK
jgi:hypothetical protein